MGGGGVLNIVIHGVIRTATTLGQTFSKGSASAPIQIGPKGGIVVEGINPTASTTNVVTITATDVDSVLIAANPNRNYLMIQNQGLYPVWLGFGAPAVANTGVIIPPGFYWEPNIILLGEINGICDTSLTSKIVILECEP